MRVNDTGYHGFIPNRSEYVEESDGKTTGFVSVSRLRADYSGVPEIAAAGRMRRKTENEDSDIRKNHGYGPGHKYSGVSPTAAENYCRCLQIAHMINQLSESGSLSVPLLTGKMTLKHLRDYMPGEIRHKLPNYEALKESMKRRIQLRCV